MAKSKKQKSEPAEGNDSNSGGYHISVLLHESIDALAIKPNGIYIDATFGGGGHSRAIMAQLGSEGHLYGFDQDEDAHRNAIDDERFTLVQANFRDIKKFLRLYGVEKVDGILADLGVSSWQFDTAERGFSYRFDGPLDMRMSQFAEQTAADILNTYSAEKLHKLFGEYGELRNAKTFANAIVAARETTQFETIGDLKTLAESNVMGEKMKYLSQVFQALRIEVNDELGALQDLLKDSVDLLKPEGRLAIITFHSLEDRLVKNFMKNGNFEDEPEKDFFGNIKRDLKPVNKKPIEASAQELKVNNRSRSAKLRVAERIG